MSAADCSRGTCKWFDSKKGYGFITSEDGVDLFVHQSEIRAEGFRSLAEGEQVEFLVQTSQDGRQKAVNVTGPNGSHVQGEPRRGPPRGGYNSGYEGGYGNRGGGYGNNSGYNNYRNEGHGQGGGGYGGGPQAGGDYGRRQWS